MFLEQLGILIWWEPLVVSDHWLNKSLFSSIYMAKRRFQLSAEEAHQVHKFMDECEDNRLKTRLNAVLLFGTGTPGPEIQTRLRCSRSSIMNWCHVYRSKGIEGLVDRRKGGNRARLLADHVEDLSRLLHSNTPQMFFGQSTTIAQGKVWTVEDLYRVVKYRYGIVYRSRTSYYNLLARLSLNHQKGDYPSQAHRHSHIASNEGNQP